MVQQMVAAVRQEGFSVFQSSSVLPCKISAVAVCVCVCGCVCVGVCGGGREGEGGGEGWMGVSLVPCMFAQDSTP